MELIHALLVPARGGVDQRATRRAGVDPGSSVDTGRLNGCLGVTPILKATAQPDSHLW